MMKMITKTCLFIGLLFCSFNIIAQDYDLDVNLFIPPPHPSNFDAYIDYLEQGIVQLTNNSDDPIEAFFEVLLTEESGKISVRKRADIGQSITVDPGLRVLTSSDIVDIFSGLSESSIETPGLSSAERQALILNKQMPEGDYKLCIFAFNAQMQAISDPEGLGCMEFEITFPERPIIELPDDEEVVDPLGSVTITWSHYLSTVEALTRTKYKLKIIDLTQQNIENAQNAMLNPGIDAEYEEEMMDNSKLVFIQDEIDMPLIKGHKYAVRVTAIDPLGLIAYQFGGHSEIMTFIYGTTEGSETPDLVGGIRIAPSIIFPGDNTDVVASENISIKWEHDIVNKDGLIYTMKIIDRTNEVNTSTLTDKEDFENDTYRYVVNSTVVSNDTTMIADSTIWVEGHNYSMIVKAEVSDSSRSFSNDGYSEVVYFTYVGSIKEEKGENCGAEMISTLPSDQKSVTLKEKKKYDFGKVELYVNKGFTGSESVGYNGTGYIEVKLSGKDVKVKVDFKDLKVNDDKVVFAGTAKGQSDSDVNLDEKIAKYISGNSTLPFEEVAGITTYARLETKRKLAKNGDPVALPLGIDRDVAGEKLVVGISEMSFSPERASLTALFSIENMQWTENVPTLGATDVCFSKEGIGENVKLYLVKDVAIPVDGDTIKLKASYDSGQSELLGTYIKFGRSREIEGQITAELGVSRNILLPEQFDGSVKPTGRVKATLSGKFKSVKNFVLSAKIDPCQIPGLDGFSFQLKSGYYDASETMNPLGIVFPNGLEEAKSEGLKWKGIWFSDALIKAPKGWGLAGDKDRTEIKIKNFIKDKVGISIQGEANGLLGINEGSIEGFAISIDKIKLDIIRNQFKSIKMEGQLGIPILPKDKPLQYVGTIDNEMLQKAKDDKTENALSMSFAIKPNEKGYDIKWLKAHVDFDGNTQFLLKNDSLEKGLKGTMGGVLSIKTSDSDTTSLILPRVKFEGMELSKFSSKSDNDSVANNQGEQQKKSFNFVAPKFSLVGLPAIPTIPGTSTEEGGVNDDSAEDGSNAKKEKVNGFSFELIKLEFDKDEQSISEGSEIGLNIQAKVMLVGEAKKGNEKGFAISALGGIKLKSKVSFDNSLNTNAILQKIKFGSPSIQLNKLSIEAELKAIKIKGDVEFVNGDTTYGKGAAGSLYIETPFIGVDLQARFGTKDDYNYWCMFGKAGRVGNNGTKPNTPLFPKSTATNPGMIQLWGFSGGAYYHMKDKGQVTEETDVTLSRYVPNNSIKLGLKAGVTIAMDKTKFGSKKEVFWANPELGMEIGTGTKITLEGSGYLMKDEMTPNTGGDVDGIEFKLINTPARPTAFNIKTSGVWDLQANMDVFVNMEGGIMQGGYPNYKMVEASLKVSEAESYIKLGTPIKPGLAKFTIPGTNISITPSAYLMAGYNTTLPVAQLDPFISGMFGSSNKGYSGGVSNASESTRKPAKVGFAFGAKLDVSLNLRAAILYADFRAMAGFDLSLVQQDVTCVGTGKKGIDGWYANGKVYAGFRGDMGLYIDIFFYEGKISLLTLKAAMLIDGGLPNPVYANGRAAMSYRVLGGLVSGSTSFKVSIGEKCEQIIEDDLGLDDQFIAAMYPGDGTKNISVFAKPMVSFNGQMGTNKTTINDKDQIYVVEIPETTTITKDDGTVEVVDSPNAGQVKTFRVRIESFSFEDSSTKQKVKGSGKLYDNIEYGFKISEMLNEDSPYNFRIVLRADEYDIKTGKWVPFKKKSGELWELEKIHNFTSGKKPDRITRGNVDFSYPLNYQTHYLQESNTSKKGFVQFGVPVDYLFEPITDNTGQWKSEIKVKFYKSNNNSQEKGYKSSHSKIIHSSPLRGDPFYTTDPIYKSKDVKNNKFEMGKFFIFEMPEDLANSKVFYIKIVRSYYKNAEFTKDKLASVKNVEYNATFNIKGKDYSNYPPQKPPDKVLYWTNFGTSKYNTWQEKLNSNPESGQSTFDERGSTPIEEYYHTLDEDFTDYEKYGKEPGVSSDDRFKRPLVVSLYNESYGGIANSAKIFFRDEDEFVKKYKKVFKDKYGFELDKLIFENDQKFKRWNYKWGYRGSAFGCMQLIWEERWKGKPYYLNLYPMGRGQYFSSLYWGAQYKSEILLDILATVNVRLEDVDENNKNSKDWSWLKSRVNIYANRNIYKDFYKKEGSEYKFNYISKPMDTRLSFRYLVPMVNHTRTEVRYQKAGNSENFNFKAK